MLTSETPFVARKEVYCTEIDGELVMLVVESGMYVGIDGSGVRMWELLSEPTTPDAIGQQIAAEFDVPPEKAREDALAFCVRLHEVKLVTALDASAP